MSREFLKKNYELPKATFNCKECPGFIAVSCHKAHKIMHIPALLPDHMRAYRLTFQNRSTAWLVDMQQDEPISTALSAVLDIPRKTLVIVGGANGLTDADFRRLERLFTQVICPFAETHGLIVVDGGTDCGVMRLMGQSRRKVGATFPLLGVVVKSMIYFPDETPTHPDQAPLEANHSHFVLVPGDEWGDESAWIARVADSVSGGMASATLLVNGGHIALNQDVPNSLQRSRPVLVMAGSGRAADTIAAALKGTQPSQQLASIINTGLIKAVNLGDQTETATQTLELLFQS
jgi:hypothetical protein